MRASVDRDVCVGSAFCARIAPAVFSLDADGHAQVAGDGTVPPEDGDLAREAEAACPAAAILVDDRPQELDRGAA